MIDSEKAGVKFAKLVNILDILRGEGGCPWDKAQDEKSIANYFLEEAYEAIDAINSGKADALAEELGDVLMEVVFLARIFKEQEKFSIADVLEGINRKMIQRHPHVFSQKQHSSSKRVFEEWHQYKKEEKSRQSIFNGMAKSFPSLLEAFQIGLRASSIGFDWEAPLDAMQKVKEEFRELETALRKKNQDEIFQELGDLFFSMVNVSRLLGVNPEIALQQANKKFIKRFKFIEKKLSGRGKESEQLSLKELDEIWDEAKEKIR
jgi:MazG family protein